MPALHIMPLPEACLVTAANSSMIHAEKERLFAVSLVMNRIKVRFLSVQAEQ